MRFSEAATSVQKRAAESSAAARLYLSHAQTARDRANRAFYEERAVWWQRAAQYDNSSAAIFLRVLLGV